MAYNPATTIALKFTNLTHNLVISYVKLITKLVSFDGLGLERNITAGSLLTSRLVNLQFIFSDRYHLKSSVVAWVCSSMMGLMLGITSFNRWRTSFLLLLLNVFLKVRVMYFKADSTILGAFECLECSTGAPLTYTSSTINFLGVQGRFSDELGPSRVVWHNCCLKGCFRAFWQLLKCFSKLLARLMALPPYFFRDFWWMCFL